MNALALLVPPARRFAARGVIVVIGFASRCTLVLVVPLAILAVGEGEVVAADADEDVVVVVMVAEGEKGEDASGVAVAWSLLL